jgi:hypothetical protein
MMDRSDECVCCPEVPEMLSLNEEVMIIKKIKDHLSCITDNPAFTAVCLNMFVLRTAWYQYGHEYENPFEGPDNQKNRHIVYRQLARFGCGGGGGGARKACSCCPAIVCLL